MSLIKKARVSGDEMFHLLASGPFRAFGGYCNLGIRDIR